MPFIPDKSVEHLRPADYNPRAITPDALKNLQKSIHLFGFAKPVIFRDGDLLLAGHQRIKASKSLQVETVPAFQVEAPVASDDEARFNQLHNGTDLEVIEAVVNIAPGKPEDLRRFRMVDSSLVQGNFRAQQANLRQLITRLLTQYGNWGGVVATMSGRIVSSPHYALACAQIGMPVRTYRIEDGLETEARRLFTYQYGSFCYDHLPRLTYVQSLAQPYRRRNAQGKDKYSDTYAIVIPGWQPKERLLDFGCGQADYLRMFQKNGRAACGIEFFHRSGAVIDDRTVHHMIQDSLAKWSTRGGFDIVVCDSVLNSIDSDQAEDDVVACVQTMAKPGGRVFFSGRSREHYDQTNRATKSGFKSGTQRTVEFLDEKGYTAYKRGDGWMFQKFHSVPQLRKLFGRFNINDIHITVDGHKWIVSGRKGDDLPESVIRGALRREFDLPWPGNRSVNRHEQALAAWAKARVIDAKHRAATAGGSTQE